MSELQSRLETSWQLVGRQMQQLLRDIPASLMTTQPGGLLNHPAWTLSHLCHYHPAILSLLRGQSVEDPALHPDADHYDEGSLPVDRPALYRSSEELRAMYQAGHEEILAAVQSTTPEILTSQPGLPRWAQSFVHTGDVLMYLMIMHESQHAGQIMSWKRAAGLSHP
jgi:uncharacterized damage-inducible protein DinB